LWIDDEPFIFDDDRGQAQEGEIDVTTLRESRNALDVIRRYYA